jgi:hypothetical protein
MIEDVTAGEGEFGVQEGDDAHVQSVILEMIEVLRGPGVPYVRERKDERQTPE